MLNLLTKLMPWMVASLLATPIFADENEGTASPSAQPCMKQYPSAALSPAAQAPNPATTPAETPNQSAQASSQPAAPCQQPPAPQPCPPKPCPAPCPPKPCAIPCPAPECKPKCCPPPPPCPQPCPPTQLCPSPPPACCPPWPVPVLNAAYNYPARILTRCPCKVFFDLSFIAWQPMQDNMELGFVNQLARTTDAGNYPPSGIGAKEINMKFRYKPGFKLGIGGDFDYDHWDSHAEYTFFHSTQNQSADSLTGGIYPAWGIPGGTTGTTIKGASATESANIFNHAKEKWKLRMDILEIDLGRWYYLGTKLLVRPSGGARAAFIRQEVDVDYVNTGALGVGFVDTKTVDEKTHSWGIGPKAAIETNWQLGYGFRFFGNGELDLLFTKYTKLNYSETHTNATLQPFYCSQSKCVTLRTHLDLLMGIGWGTYIDCNNWYLDFTAGYEFQAFFDQNMFRHFNSSVMLGESTLPNGHLYLQGLTLSSRLDF